MPEGDEDFSDDVYMPAQRAYVGDKPDSETPEKPREPEKEKLKRPLSKADVIGTFIADHLQRHAGHDLALEQNRSVLSSHGLAEGVEKTGRSRPEADAGDIDFHRLTINSHVLFPVSVDSQGLRES